MKAIIENLVLTLNMNEFYTDLLVFASLIVMILILSFLANIITKKYLQNYIHKLAEKSANKMDDVLIKNKVFSNLAHLAPALVIYYMIPMLELNTQLLGNILIAYMIVVVTISIFRALDSAVEITRSKSKAKGGPLKGIIQVIKIVIIVLVVLLIIVTFMGNSTAWAIFSGIGGLSAVLLLIFKDSILGLVAGLQLSSEGLLKLGDWLEMPKYNADGEVVDISLTKITVRNWDKTYTTVPAYKFIEDAFKNWEGMSEAGGRRIKRSIMIDVGTIGFLSQTQMDELMKIDILKPYLEEKLGGIGRYNKEKNKEHDANLRKLTNIGTFRAYIEAYLKNHDQIHKGFTLLVRQLTPNEKGLPIEIYCFTNTTAWGEYEGIQSDIFDHLFAILPSFELKAFQQPSGEDFQKIIRQ